MARLIARRLAFALSASIAGALATAAHAGPPFATDDPEPTDLHRWEIYNFVGGSHTPGDTSGEAGLDLNYGGAKDLQLTAVIPAQFSGSHGQDWGMGDVELAAKYRFLHQAGPTSLDVAFFPRVFLPTTYDRHSDRHAALLLPIWAGRDYGKWSVFGGGGYTINPGPGNRGFWTSGLAVQRQVSERLMLGGEGYDQTRDTMGGKDFTGVNLGGAYKLVDHWSVLFSGGPGVQNARSQGQYDFYLSLKADY